MVEFLLASYLKPIKLVVFITLIHAALKLNKRTSNNIFLEILLLVCFLTELINPILKFCTISNSLFITISIILHHTIWLIILLKNTFLNKTKFAYLAFFIVFAIFNLVFYSGIKKFNYYTFVFGALMYIAIFIWKSFNNLKEEKFVFFFSNVYILLCAPVLFFFGYSFMFAFDSRDFTGLIIFRKIFLFDFISIFVNIIYYTLINIYIYREKKLQHAQ